MRKSNSNSHITLGGVESCGRLFKCHNMSFKGYNKLSKRDICCFDFHSHFLGSVFLRIDIGKEISQVQGEGRSKLPA